MKRRRRTARPIYDGDAIRVSRPRKADLANSSEWTATGAMPDQPENTIANRQTRKARTDEWCGSIVALSNVTMPCVVAGRQRRRRNEGQCGNHGKRRYAQVFHKLIL